MADSATGVAKAMGFVRAKATGHHGNCRNHCGNYCILCGNCGNHKKSKRKESYTYYSVFCNSFHGFHVFCHGFQNRLHGFHRICVEISFMIGSDIFKRLKVHSLQKYARKLYSRLHSDFFRCLRSISSPSFSRPLFKQHGFGICDAPLEGETLCSRALRCKPCGAAGASREGMARVNVIGRRCPPQAHVLGARDGKLCESWSTRRILNGRILGTHVHVYPELANQSGSIVLFVKAAEERHQNSAREAERKPHPKSRHRHNETLRMYTLQIKP